ncbi:MAG: hypothetical protein K1X66_08135 [Verrucomicrobiae bacterium]|nr:hypothetical protein [Verrucomicrobiae bacterium]
MAVVVHVKMLARGLAKLTQEADKAFLHIRAITRSLSDQFINGSYSMAGVRAAITEAQALSANYRNAIEGVEELAILARTHVNNLKSTGASPEAVELAEKMAEKIQAYALKLSNEYHGFVDAAISDVEKIAKLAGVPGVGATVFLASREADAAEVVKPLAPEVATADKFWCPKASLIKETSDVAKKAQERIRSGEVRPEEPSVWELAAGERRLEQCRPWSQVPILES